MAALLSGAEPPPSAFQPATLLAVPLFHVTGSHAVYLMSYRAERKLVSMYKWDPELAAELIERERITSFVAPAAMTGDLIRVARETNRDLSSLQTVGGGGAPRAPEQVRQIKASFASAMPNTGWGMTETNAIGTGIAGLDYLERPASSGRGAAVLELKIVDEAATRLPSGERGELLVRGTSVFQGYWNRPDVNAEVLIAGGWFRTGDVAYLDDEGFLFIVDRIKDLIIRGGENIGCGQVEAALLHSPAMCTKPPSTRCRTSAWARRWALRSTPAARCLPSPSRNTSPDISPVSRSPATWTSNGTHYRERPPVRS